MNCAKANLEGPDSPRPADSDPIRSSNSPFRVRLRAALTHAALSATLATVLVLLVSFVWYPSPLFELTKGRNIFFILVSCDIVLGPVMTLIIFNTKKPRVELVRDVAIIVVIQIAAMCYGVATLLEARPAYIVYNAGQFNVALANELTSLNGMMDPKGQADLPRAPWGGPKLVGTRSPEDPEEKNRLLSSAIDGKGDIFQMPSYYVPYSSVLPEVAAHSLSVEKFSAKLHLPQDLVVQATEHFSNRGLSVGLLPLVIKGVTAIAVVDAKSGDFLGIEALPPTH
jgi:hypothetical protein